MRNMEKLYDTLVRRRWLKVATAEGLQNNVNFLTMWLAHRVFHRSTLETYKS